MKSWLIWPILEIYADWVLLACGLGEGQLARITVTLLDFDGRVLLCSSPTDSIGSPPPNSTNSNDLASAND